MTTEEFSNEFDVLVQSFSRQTQYGDISTEIAFNEYEKSVFLTKAQEAIVIELYSGKNPNYESFEKTEEIRRYLSSITKTYKTSDKVDTNDKITQESTIFRLPPDLWYITYEAVDLEDSNLGCLKGTNVWVHPITQDELHRLKNNPFRNANYRRVLRLDITSDSVELLSKYNISQYIVRYLAKPSPIILQDLSEGLTINNVSSKTDCSLSSSIHRLILNRAVEMALQSKSIQYNKPNQ